MSVVKLITLGVIVALISFLNVGICDKDVFEQDNVVKDDDKENSVIASSGEEDLGSNILEKIGGTGCPRDSHEYLIADSKQCDKFHVCSRNGYITKSYLCLDGMIFDGKHCSLPFGYDCGSRKALQKPKSKNSNCPRLNGHFHIEDNCHAYRVCTNGVDRTVNCAGHLVYSKTKGVCTHPDQADRPECSAEKLYGFECPKVRTVYNIFPSQEDCRAYFVCSLPGFPPHLGGCPFTLVFNPKTLRCDHPANVEGCENYYDDANSETSLSV
jgi:hypothetical protein